MALSTGRRFCREPSILFKVIFSSSLCLTRFLTMLNQSLQAFLLLTNTATPLPAMAFFFSSIGVGHERSTTPLLPFKKVPSAFSRSGRSVLKKDRSCPDLQVSPFLPSPPRCESLLFPLFSFSPPSNTSTRVPGKEPAFRDRRFNGFFLVGILVPSTVLSLSFF